MTYNTKQKELILKCLKDSDNCLSVKDIELKLKDIVGQTTIYRNLNTLVNEGKITKYYNLDGTTALYKYLDCGNTHHHLICLKCGKLYHLDCEQVNDLTNHIKEKHDFLIDNNRFVLTGLCNKCK